MESVGKIKIRLLIGFCSVLVAGPPVMAAPADTVPMRTAVKLGRSKMGYKAIVKGIHVTDERFNPFYLFVELTRKEPFGLKRLLLEADDEVLVLDLPPESRADVGWYGNVPPVPEPGTSTELRYVSKEERTFPLPLEQAERLATAQELTVVLVGSSDRSSRHPVKPKELAKLRDWLEKRLALVEP
jgi:hypothetical protein